jgi:uncharacterized RDD family membrane protein YckC
MPQITDAPRAHATMTGATTRPNYAPPATTGAAANNAVPGKKQVVLASIGLRCGAFLLDYILTLVVLAVTVLLAYFFKRRLQFSEGANVVLLIGYLCTAAVLFLNLVYFAERTGQSFGKRFIGIRIVRADGRRPDYRDLALRHFIGYPLAIICGGLGILWMIWDRKQQGWHDKLSSTLVVKE